MFKIVIKFREVCKSFSMWDINKRIFVCFSQSHTTVLLAVHTNIVFATVTNVWCKILDYQTKERKLFEERNAGFVFKPRSYLWAPHFANFASIETWFSNRAQQMNVS